jgi:hypothetical protein
MTWQDVWNILRDHGIPHSPAGFEPISQPVAVAGGLIQYTDGHQQPCLLFTFAVPLQGPQPPISLDELLEAVQRGDEYLRAWLQGPDAERIRRGVTQG